MKTDLSGVYFKKQFDVPLPIGKSTENLEEIAIHPGKGFIDVKLLNEYKESKVTIGLDGFEWSGTMEDLIKKLK
jgi:hypothetical protein